MLHTISLGLGAFSLVIGLGELWFGRLPGSSAPHWGYQWLSSPVRVRVAAGVGVVVSVALIRANLPQSRWDIVALVIGMVGGSVTTRGMRRAAR